jgi:DNA-binding MarR family transcriptional regulator
MGSEKEPPPGQEAGGRVGEEGVGGEADLEAAKRASVGQLLMKCGRLVNELGVERMRGGMGLQGLRTAHMNLFPHIDMEGTRLTDLAGRVGISKQAVGQLVDQLDEMGAIERVPDPQDGRAKLIRFRREGGRSVLMKGLAVLGQIEGEVEAELGTRQMRQLHRSLVSLEAFLTKAGAED